jgi:uncharacterized phage protein (predicted DNA packaging)
MTVDEVKKYLRIEDITSEDDFIQSLITAAESYINGKTGKTRAKTKIDENTGLPVYGPITDDKVYQLCDKMLISHWYSNRDSTILGTLANVPHTVDDIINFIALCGDYVGN